MSTDVDNGSSLQSRIRTLPSDTKLWVSSRGVVTVSDLCNEISSRQDELQRFRGSKVALQFEDDLLLAKALVLLDGVAQQIFLLPSDISPSIADQFLVKSESTVLLTDSPSRPSAPNVACSSSWSGGELPMFDSQPSVLAGTTDWILATSGTTGVPKLVVHSVLTLTRSVRPNVEKGRSFCWGLLYELARFAGLQVYLQAMVSGSILVFPERGMSFDKRLRFLAESGCNALSATPTMWRKIMMSATGELLQLKQVTLGGEIADQNLLTALTRRYPAARVVHIYASTEAGVGFAVKDAIVGFPADWIETPPSGIFLKVDSDGMLYIRADRQHQSYLADEGGPLVGEEGYICTGDIVRKSKGRYLFQGRSSGAINVGGSKVHPEEVEEVLLELPEVSLCRVYARSNPFTGQLVVADVVPTDRDLESAQLQEVVVNHCRAKLPPFKVPALVNKVEDLSLSTMGKVIRP